MVRFLPHCFFFFSGVTICITCFFFTLNLSRLFALFLVLARKSRPSKSCLHLLLLHFFTFSNLLTATTLPNRKNAARLLPPSLIFRFLQMRPAAQQSTGRHPVPSRLAAPKIPPLLSYTAFCAPQNNQTKLKIVRFCAWLKQTTHRKIRARAARQDSDDGGGNYQQQQQPFISS